MRPSEDIAMAKTAEMEPQTSIDMMEETHRDSRCDTVLNGRYRVIKLLGQGAMGDVYRGEHLELGKPVAIKFLRELYLSDQKSRARFVREAKVMSKLSHPHCVSIIDSGIDGCPYIVMDYVKGSPLDFVVQDEEITCSRAIRITLQVLAGLAHAHRQGIIHRDIKPENIIIQQAAGTGEHAWILDFSLAKMEDRSGITLNGDIIGTPAFMSPEQANGFDIDGRADLYSVGLVLFELLTGNNPFECDDVHQTLDNQCNATAPKLGEVQPARTFSTALEAVVKKSLAKSPNDRFQDSGEFIDALLSVPEAGDLSDVLARKQTRLRIDDSAMTIDISFSDENEVKESWSEQDLAIEGETFAARLHGSILEGIPVGALFVIFMLIAGWRFPSDATTAIVHTNSMQKDTNQLLENAQKPHRIRNNSHIQSTHSAEIAHAKKLILAGNTDRAIELLQKIRSSYPQASEPPYLLANLFAKKEWWSDAISRYKVVIDKEPDYKKDPLLNKNAIRALVSNKAYGQAYALIVEQIGPNAISHLRHTIKNTDSVRLRRRAAKILNELTKAQKSLGRRNGRFIKDFRG